MGTFGRKFPTEMCVCCKAIPTDCVNLTVNTCLQSTIKIRDKVHGRSSSEFSLGKTFRRCQKMSRTSSKHLVSRSNAVFNVVFSLHSIFRPNLHPVSRFLARNFTLTVKTPGEYVNLFRFTDEGT